MLYKAAMAGLRTLGERIRFARTELRMARGLPKLSQQAIADALGIQKMSISHWENNNGEPTGIERLSALADLLGVTDEWLQRGKGLPERTENSNVVHASSGGRRVPVVNPSAVVRDYDKAVSEATEYINVFGNVGDRAYAVIVWDKSNAPEFDVGHALVFDPDQKTLPGDYCIARVGSEGEPVVGILAETRSDGKLTRTIETVNPRWADVPLAADDEIKACAVQHVRFLKR